MIDFNAAFSNHRPFSEILMIAFSIDELDGSSDYEEIIEQLIAESLRLDRVKD